MNGIKFQRIRGANTSWFHSKGGLVQSCFCRGHSPARTGRRSHPAGCTGLLPRPAPEAPAVMSASRAWSHHGRHSRTVLPAQSGRHTCVASAVSPRQSGSSSRVGQATRVRDIETIQPGVCQESAHTTHVWHGLDWNTQIRCTQVEHTDQVHTS